jgi:hypothetical protein
MSPDKNADRVDTMKQMRTMNPRQSDTRHEKTHGRNGFCFYKRV